MLNTIETRTTTVTTVAFLEPTDDATVVADNHVAAHGITTGYRMDHSAECDMTCVGDACNGTGCSITYSSVSTTTVHNNN